MNWRERTLNGAVALVVGGLVFYFTRSTILSIVVVGLSAVGGWCGYVYVRIMKNI